MAASPTYCSHCGARQTGETTETVAGFATLHCTSCRGITLRVGRGWQGEPEPSAQRLPLAPLLHWQENEYACIHCEARVGIEFTLRSSPEPASTCSACSSLTREEPAFAEHRDLVPSVVSAAEFSFLSAPAARD